MKARKIPQRMCVGCQEMKNKKDLIRVVRTPDGEILIDETGKKAGRGAYVCRSEECFKKSVKAKRLEKALKNSVSEEVYEKILSGMNNE